MTEARYRHWKNFGNPGDLVFLTATCLDFAHLFREPHQKDVVTAGILDDCLHYGAALRAYVVMSNHLHLLVRLPNDQPASEFMKRIKGNAVARFAPLLTPEQRAELRFQTGLNRRAYWARSFRGVRVVTDRAKAVKTDYIRGNPLKAGLCETPEAYRWSSAYAFAHGCHDEWHDLDMRKALALYQG